MGEHTCHARGCDTRVPPKMFMCRPHSGGRRWPWSPAGGACRRDLAANGGCYCGKLRPEGGGDG